MHPVIKVVYYVVLIVNVLASAFYFFAMLYELFFKAGSFRFAWDSIAFLLISITALGLLGWSYYLAVIQERVGAGFKMLLLAYLAWPILLVIAFLFVPIKNWR
ncbi:hypothetical protein GCM10027592_36860 [Spirosoma flavus]